LFQQPVPCDNQLSMRWDPIEDRRYAYMWNDPGKRTNRPKTNWALNLLAYQALQMLPCVPTQHGLRTAGWSNKKVKAWTWPIWNFPMTAILIRSLLCCAALNNEEINRESLFALGVIGVYRSDRIQGAKNSPFKNFTPAQRIA